MFRCILKKSGLEGVGVHSIRHTFASRLFAKGVDVKTVSDLLGHSEVGVTYDTYIHLIQEQHVIAVETLENVLL
jgi:site-specific recombinase XerD